METQYFLKRRDLRKPLPPNVHGMVVCCGRVGVSVGETRVTACVCMLKEVFKQTQTGYSSSLFLLKFFLQLTLHTSY